MRPSRRQGTSVRPWAIGAAEGGHTAVHPDLGTLDDFALFVAEAGREGLEVALDYALQCSPDHPWVGEHPEWFRHRADGTIRYAENPPKRYQDIYPLDFGSADRPVSGRRFATWCSSGSGKGCGSSGSTTRTPSRSRSGSG